MVRCLTSYWCRSLSGNSAKKWLALTIHFVPVLPLPGRRGNLTDLLDGGTGWIGWAGAETSSIVSVLKEETTWDDSGGWEDVLASDGSVDWGGITPGWCGTWVAWCSSGTCGLDGPPEEGPMPRPLWPPPLYPPRLPCWGGPPLPLPWYSGGPPYCCWGGIPRPPRPPP